MAKQLAERGIASVALSRPCQLLAATKVECALDDDGRQRTLSTVAASAPPPPYHAKGRLQRLAHRVSGGIRVPFTLRWTGTIPAGQADPSKLDSNRSNSNQKGLLEVLESHAPASEPPALLLGLPRASHELRPLPDLRCRGRRQRPEGDPALRHQPTAVCRRLARERQPARRPLLESGAGIRGSLGRVEAGQTRGASGTADWCPTTLGSSRDALVVLALRRCTICVPTSVRAQHALLDSRTLHNTAHEVRGLRTPGNPPPPSFRRAGQPGQIKV